MILVESNFEMVPEGFHHSITFEFEGRTFFALVVETQNETFIRDCFVVLENHLPIDIPKYFGEFKNDVFQFIYDSITYGLPESPSEASVTSLVKVEWFDYAKETKHVKMISQVELEWMQEQRHIKINKVY